MLAKRVAKRMIRRKAISPEEGPDGRQGAQQKNLLDLGADTLADLLLEAVKGDAARQRRVRMALSADLRPETISAEVRKRFASNRHFAPFPAGIDFPRISVLPDIQRYRRDDA